jgi:4,5-dihydroxyphthalate decarboxylase
MPISIMSGNRYATKQLVNGNVKVQGFDVDFPDWGTVAPLFNSFYHNLDQDAVDLPLSNYIIARDLGKPITAVPTFPTRFQPLMGPMVNRKSGIKTVNDLIGKKVGVQGFAFNPAVYLRGMLTQMYNFPVEEIIWVEGEPNSTSNIPYGRDSRFKIEKAPRSIMDMVNDGELDAVFMSDGGLDPTDKLDRLFEDPWVEIRKFYEKTDVFPVNAAVVFRNEILEANPGLDKAVVKAYQEAWDRYVAEEPDSKHMMLALSEMEKLGVIPLKEGFSANRKNIAWIAKACHDQGLTKRLWEPEELFPQID